MISLGRRVDCGYAERRNRRCLRWRNWCLQQWAKIQNLAAPILRIDGISIMRFENFLNRFLMSGFWKMPGIRGLIDVRPFCFNCGCDKQHNKEAEKKEEIVGDQHERSRPARFASYFMRILWI